MMWYIAIMRILFVADGRSRTTLSWLQYWVERNDEVHFISTFHCDQPAGVSSFHIIPVAFGGFSSRAPGSTMDQGDLKWVKGSRHFFRSVRNILGPLSLPIYWQKYRLLVGNIHPDLVHALRIPYEGMLASITSRDIPLIVSIWGNDLTLHAPASPLMGLLTRKVLHRVEGLMADASRDIQLSEKWGFAKTKPALVIPGGGGISLQNIQNLADSSVLPEELPDVPIVVNPRGHRAGSLRQDNFFRAIPMVVEEFPDALFVCPPLQGDREAEKWVDQWQIERNTRLWPNLDQPQLWKLYWRSHVFVSPSIHDGTPNSLLEAMACGCFPVTGDIESMREWIQDGRNGFLVDANSPQSIAAGIITALKDPSLRKVAAKENARLVSEHAEREQCMSKAAAFYNDILGK